MLRRNMLLVMVVAFMALTLAACSGGSGSSDSKGKAFADEDGTPMGPFPITVYSDDGEFIGYLISHSTDHMKIYNDDINKVFTVKCLTGEIRDSNPFDYHSIDGLSSDLYLLKYNHDMLFIVFPEDDKSCLDNPRSTPLPSFKFGTTTTDLVSPHNIGYELWRDWYYEEYSDENPDEGQKCFYEWRPVDLSDRGDSYPVQKVIEFPEDQIPFTYPVQVPMYLSVANH